MIKHFEEGEYIVYVDGEKCELGRVVKTGETGAFVCYHEGETAALTPYSTIHKLINGYTIIETTIGGERFNE